MLRTIACLFLAAALAASAFAQAPELPPIGSGDPKPPALPPVGGTKPPPANSTPGPAHLGDPDPVAPSSPNPALPRGNDLEFVEKVIEARRAYANSIKSLVDHYRAAGDTRRAQMAEEELRSFHRSAHPVYRLELDVPSAKLQPLYNQKEANDLYRWAMTYKDKGVGPDYTDNQHRAEIILQELLSKYPQSNKISDVAFMLGDLYEGRAFRQFDRAAAYYERCFQWDAKTPYDARLRAARIYDRDLKDRNRAVELYRAAAEFETTAARRQEAQRRLSDLGAR
jgi:TolA-binding protein